MNARRVEADAGLATSGRRLGRTAASRRPGRRRLATARSSTSRTSRVSFDGFKALNKLTLTIDVGELRCIIGPNGAGKTTMMDVITGKTRPDAGTRLLRPDHRPDAPDRSRRSRTPASAASSRSRPSSSSTRVFENLELALKTDKRVRASLFARGSTPRSATASPRRWR